MSVDLQAEPVVINAKKSGAWLARYALEQLPVSHTFGIPGVHNTELYDELNISEQIQPVLVTHEAGAAFMGDAVSRTSGGQIGVLLIVPAAGLTHAMSGIGEAYLDGIPLLVISGGIRTDSDVGYQLHELDQHRLVDGITKGSWHPKSHDEIVPAIYEAYRTATSGCPGPVLVEIPVNLQLYQQKIDTVPAFVSASRDEAVPLHEGAIESAARMLVQAKHPGLFVGWGAVDAHEQVREIAELLGAPVSTTLQGMSTFGGDHPLHAGMGFSRAAVPAAVNAFANCDCMLAVGTRFGEIPTGSFGCEVPEQLIHIDIDPDVIGRNWPATIGIESDARLALDQLLEALRSMVHESKQDIAARRTALEAQIAKDKQAYRNQWLKHKSDRVNPAVLLAAMRTRLNDDAICVVDDGNHTFLAAELFEVRTPRSFISPTDFNCMGYCVPAAIGAKLVNPDAQVVGIVGDGAFVMTCMEIITASAHGLGIVYFIFSDGELSQISQAQQIPYNRKTCTLLSNMRIEGVAMATGAHFVAINDNSQVDAGIEEAMAAASKGQPVIVDVRIDYSKRTAFTEGIVATNLKRFPMGEKVRFIGRAIRRRVTG